MSIHAGTRRPRHVLVTGAVGALGSAVAARFVAEGVQVTGAYLGPAAPPARAGMRWVAMDLTRSDSIAAALGDLKDPVDSLVHCAGGFRWVTTEKFTDEDLDFLLDTNLKSSFLLARALLPAMRAQGFGRIVFVGAKATLQPGAGMGPYTASKIGLNALTLALAEEVKGADINVNAVLPSIIDTPANRKDMPDADPSKWVSASELAAIIYDLTQPEKRAIHGALIPVSGRV